MIIEFRVANFRSFKDEQTLSLVAGKDQNHPNALIPVDNDYVLKAAALYGANASGKSNLIRAMMVMRAFVLGSATNMNQGDPIKDVAPFRLDEETGKQPAQFGIKMMVGSTCYEYAFAASEAMVQSESLFAKPAAGSRRRLFERTSASAQEQTPWDFGDSLKKDAPLLQSKTRDNGLVLSRGAELNIPELRDVYLWFRNGMWVFDLSQPPLSLVWQTATAIKGDQNLRSRVTQLVRHADLGISGINSVEEPFPIHGMPEEVRQAFKEDALKRLMGSTKMAVHTTHPLGQSGRDVEFDLERDESNGTQRLFALAGPFFDALEKGAAVVVDELECSLHPLLTRKLVEMFQSDEMNKKGAQLIFATHDVTLMDSQLLRRDQVWLVEKNSSGASELYSLYDFKEGEEGDRPRSTEAFRRNYLAGRYGAVPSFGPALEDLDIR